MKFQVNRDVFSEAVSFAVKLLPQRTTQPILSGVLLEAADGRRRHARRRSTTRSPLAPRSRPRSTSPARRSSPADCSPTSPAGCRTPRFRFSTDDGKITVSCGSARFTLLSMPVEEYPTLPQVSEQTGVLPAEDFATAIAQVAVAASRDDVTPVITGVQLEVGDNSLSLVATDRYRVAVREIDWDVGIDLGRRHDRTRAGTHAHRDRQDLRTQRHHLRRDRARRRPRAHRVQRRQEDRDVAAHQGQLPAGQAALPRDRRQLRGHQHRRAHRGGPSRVARARARGRRCGSPSRSTGSRSRPSGTEQAQASETIDAHLHGDDTVVSLKPQFLLDGLERGALGVRADLVHEDARIPTSRARC